MKYFIIISSVLLSFTLMNCKQSTSTVEEPDWIKVLITKYQNDPVGNPPQSIWEYEYKGRIVYYVPPQCCDQFSVLFDSKGNAICAPDGGITGTGNGQCPDFFQLRKNEKLIWKDSRTR